MRPLILVSNDDGFQAKGILSLVEVAKQFGDVVVVAPDGGRSGMSAALTPYQPLRVTEVRTEEGAKWYKCTGTPVDCVKVAFCHILERRPDLVLSGINHGSNAAINIIYSGTMGATLEGSVQGVPSIGFSLCSHDEEADFEETKRVAAPIIRAVLERGLPQGVCLNVNVPSVPSVKGIRVCRQANSKWSGDFERSTDPYGKEVYWLTGHFANLEPESTDTDVWAIHHGYASVVPSQLDHTAFAHLQATADLLSQECGSTDESISKEILYTSQVTCNR